MPAYFPIPSTRTSGLMVAQRMLAQLQAAQLDLLRAQNQVSTGRRIEATSDDPAAAVRAIALRRTLERKAQIKTNLQAAQSYYNATDAALNSAGGLLADVRGSVLTVIGATSTDTQRRAVAEEVNATLQQFLQIANTQFRERYLFAGSTSSSPPFADAGGYVRYQGNELNLNTYADLDQLLATNAHGVEVFGAVSAQQRGGVDLQPILTAETPLADLNGGAGVRLGTLLVSDGAGTAAVDLSTAATIGDVIRTLEANPPPGRQIITRIANHGLTVELVDAGTEALTIRDPIGSYTASDLGILEAVAAPGGFIQGADLNPRLTPTTKLSSLAGVRAAALVPGAGSNNDLIFEAQQRGAEGNGLTIQFVDDGALRAAGGIAAGQEYVEYHAAPVAARASLRLLGLDNDLLLTANAAGTAANNISIVLEAGSDLGDAASATYDPDARVLTLHIDDSGETTLDALVNAINAQGLFTATPDPSAAEGYDGLATVSAANAGTTAGQTGNSGAEANSLLVYVNATQTTANHVIAAIEADATAHGLVQVRLDGHDTSSPSFAGSGLIDLAATGITAGGSGVELDLAPGLRIEQAGAVHTITFDQAQTVEDLLNLINGSEASVLASINAAGTGIDLRSRLSGADLRIGENGGLTATQLGLRSFDRATILNDLNYGAGVERAAGADLIVQRSDGTQFEIDLDGAYTVGDVLDAINGHPDNQNPATRIVARFVAVGNGLELVDANPAGASPPALLRPAASHAAWDLGLIARGEDARVATEAGPPWTFSGSDPNPLESRGVFNTLLRLQNALLANDQAAIARTVELLDQDLDRLSFARAEIGARSRGVDLMLERWTDENVELQANLSQQIDVDAVEAIAALTQRQFAYEAALRASAQLFQMSLLDFL